MEMHALQPLAQQLFADIRALTFDGVGVTRASYGEGENACAAYLEKFVRSEGLDVTTDRAGNFIYFDPADTRSTLRSGAARTWTRCHRVVITTAWLVWLPVCWCCWRPGVKASRCLHR